MTTARIASGSTASGTQRTFGVDDIIVTKTDLKGRITYEFGWSMAGQPVSA